MFQSQTILDELLTRRHRSFLSQQIIFSYQILIDILYKVWGSNTEDYGRAIQIATGRRGDLGRSAQLFEGIFIDEPIEIEKLEESLKSVTIIERIAVTARKDDAAAADQAAKAKVAVPMSSACDGGLIQTTSG